MILLGFEADTATPIYVPLHHTVACGMTQLSGKTTTLEAMIARSGLKAVAFRTKRGESGFQQFSSIPPYFKEKSDWQYVESLVDAALGERTKFEPGIRGAIMRVSSGAKSLQEVYQRTVEALDSARREFTRDLYTKLAEYLKLVLPELEKWRFTTSISLREGVNVMDIAEMRKETQGLVIAAVIEYVHEALSGVVVVIPEAWEHIPQGYVTPVKLIAEAFIRKGAAIGNFLWIDTQDLAGIDKTPLRQCDVWILGRQREPHEIQRTLDAIPLPRTQKPNPEEIMSLKKGFFWVCFGNEVHKVYVQPSWLPTDVARDVSQGKLEPDSPEVQNFRAEAYRLPEADVELERRVEALWSLAKEVWT